MTWCRNTAFRSLRWDTVRLHVHTRSGDFFCRAGISYSVQVTNASQTGPAMYQTCTKVPRHPHYDHELGTRTPTPGSPGTPERIAPPHLRGIVPPHLRGIQVYPRQVSDTTTNRESNEQPAAPMPIRSFPNSLLCYKSRIPELAWVHCTWFLRTRIWKLRAKSVS